MARGDDARWPHLTWKSGAILTNSPQIMELCLSSWIVIKSTNELSSRMVGTHRRYDQFRRRLTSAAAGRGGVITALAELLPPLNGTSIAILTAPQTPGNGATSHILALETIAASGQQRLWDGYARLCRDNREPLSRVLRLTPHPVALSDISAHRRLGERASILHTHLATYGMDSILVVPAMNRQFGFTLVGIVGCGLMLGPANRHLIAQAAADAVVHLAGRACDIANGGPVDAVATHHTLSGRQLEIAAWLVAGKTDWEIGEILRISPKTVNYHVERMKRCYGVKSRNQFVAAIVHDGSLAPG